ncbi:hypothetical protein C8R44DRAFT_774374, partial [Mycena epipterygia]
MVYTSLIHPVSVFPTFLIFTLLLFVSPARECFDEIRTRTTSLAPLSSSSTPAPPADHLSGRPGPPIGYSTD